MTCRRLANREAARRMRRRRATHMQAVEEEVERLSNENSLLLHRMSQLVASHQQVDAENQQLRHELHALRQSVVSLLQAPVASTSDQLAVPTNLARRAFSSHKFLQLHSAHCPRHH